MKKGYLCAEGLWLFLDDYMRRLDLQSEQASDWKSESYKLIVCGRMEAMNALGDFLHENEISLPRMKKMMNEWESEDGE